MHDQNGRTLRVEILLSLPDSLGRPRVNVGWVADNERIQLHGEPTGLRDRPHVVRIALSKNGEDVMARAKEVARFLIQVAANSDEPDYLTNLRLQKLLYYVQAWSLVMRGKPMFAERIEAWVHGPVVREVYGTYASNGANVITPEAVGDEDFDLAADEKEFVGSVWESYKGYSASKLREMTHQEDPWRNAREGYGPADNCNAEVTTKSIREYFQDIPSE
jgi:uncharacterized phage-associated protein